MHQDQLLDVVIASPPAPDTEVGPIALVVLDLEVPHLGHPFEYSIPDSLRAQVAIGTHAEVRFAGRKVKGWVIGVQGHSESGKKLAPILRVLGPFPLLSEPLIRSAEYLARRYATSLGRILSFVVPPRRASEEKRVLGAAHEADGDTSAKETATEQLQQAPRPRRLVSSLYPGQMLSSLLLAVSEQRSQGRGVLVVAPTAAEADQMFAYIQAKQPDWRAGIATTSSTPQRRYRVYLQAVAGELDVVVGTRSVVWTPLANLGAIIVWDDGDDRLKEQRAPRLDALDVAVARSHIEAVDLLTVAYARSLKSQMLVHSAWAQDSSPPREGNLALIPKVRAFDWYSAQREGPQGSMRFPDSAYSLIREGLRRGPVLVQVAASGYLTPISCPECGLPTDQVTNCPHPEHARAREFGARVRVGSDKIQEQLQKAFGNTSVVVSSSTSGIIRAVGQEPQIVVATSGAEPIPSTGYAAVLITEAEGLAYLDELWAPMEATRRWFNALALSMPGAPAMLIGTFPETMLRAVVMWKPQELATAILAEREELGFPPARWVAVASGDAEATDQALVAVRAIGAGTVLDPDTPIRILAESPSLVVSTVARHVLPLMDTLREVQVQRSARRQSLLEIQANPARIALV